MFCLHILLIEITAALTSAQTFTSSKANGMAESFVKTIKRDYVYQADCNSAETVLKLLPQWFTEYNNVAPHLALGMKSPVEHKESVSL